MRTKNLFRVVISSEKNWWLQLCSDHLHSPEDDESLLPDISSETSYSQQDSF